MNPKIDRIITRAHTRKSEYPISLCLFSIWNARISPIGMKQIKKMQLTEKYLINGYYFGRYGMVSTGNTTSLRSSIKYSNFHAMHFDCMHLRLLNVYTSPYFFYLDFWSLSPWIFLILVYATVLIHRHISIDMHTILFSLIDALRKGYEIELIFPRKTCRKIHKMDCVLDFALNYFEFIGVELWN